MLIVVQTGVFLHLLSMARVLTLYRSYRRTIVVFLIGMRINQLWAVHKWMPVAAAMPSMQGALKKNPAKGLLGMEQ